MERLTTIISQSVLVNKWAQRLMYTLQTEDLSVIPDDEMARAISKLKIAQGHIEEVCREVDYQIRLGGESGGGQ